MTKKRQRKLTVYHAVEGEREYDLLTYLKQLYVSDSEKVSFSEKKPTGGNPDAIINDGLKRCDRKRCLIWIDEDIPINGDTRNALARAWCVPVNEQFIECPVKDLQSRFSNSTKKPILVVSHPVCFEGLILRILGRNIPTRCQSFSLAERSQQIQDLKSAFSGILSGESELNYYQQNLPKSFLDQKRKLIPELDLLIESVTI